MAKNEQVRSNRERYTERLKAKYPEQDFADDDELFGRINDDYDDYDNELSSYKEREASLSNLFSSNPNSAAFLMDWRNGEDPIVALMRRFGDDFKSALEDPDKQEMFAEANQKYAKRIAQEAEYEEQHRNNTMESLAMIEELQAQKGYTDDQIDAAMEFLIQIMRDGMLGKFSKESILMATKALNYDGAVEEAEQIGEVRGRNTKIDEKLRKGAKNDGTADLQGKNGGGAKPRQMPDLGALDRFDKSNSIWDR